MFSDGLNMIILHDRCINHINLAAIAQNLTNPYLDPITAAHLSQANGYCSALAQIMLNSDEYALFPRQKPGSIDLHILRHQHHPQFFQGFAVDAAFEIHHIF